MKEFKFGRWQKFFNNKDTSINIISMLVLKGLNNNTLRLHMSLNQFFTHFAI